MTASVFMALLLTQPAVPGSGPPAVPQPLELLPLPIEPPAYSSYSQGYAESRRAGKTLLLFVGVPARKVDGLVVAYTPHYERADGTRVRDALFVVLPSGYGHWLKADATDEEIQDFVNVRIERQVRPSLATPFAASRQTADVDRLAAGPWPESLPRPDGLEAYSPTKWTQQSFDRKITGRAFIQWVDRHQLERKWHQPGGLEGVAGWRSTLYRGVDNSARYWRGDENPGELYSVQAYHRSYKDGALFADVLTNENTAEVFEVRYAEKVGNRWQHYVAFKDPRHRPVGYTTPSRRQCTECHAQAGTGGYGTGRVPGGDMVLSDPFPEMGN